MKKLSNLQINSDRLMKDEDLISMRGGYGICTCMCWYGSGTELGYLVTSGDSCHDSCSYAWGWQYGDVGGYPVTPGCW